MKFDPQEQYSKWQDEQIKQADEWLNSMPPIPAQQHEKNKYGIAAYLGVYKRHTLPDYCKDFVFLVATIGTLNIWGMGRKPRELKDEEYVLITWSDSFENNGVWTQWGKIKDVKFTPLMIEKRWVPERHKLPPKGINREVIVERINRKLTNMRIEDLLELAGHLFINPFNEEEEG